MATTEELYISASPSDYRINKSNILMCQADLLATLKRLHHLKVLSRQKQDLKVRLHHLFSSILNEIKSIQDKMPSAKIPKEVKKDLPKKEKLPKELKESSKKDNIEEELMQIQNKLRELNSY